MSHGYVTSNALSALAAASFTWSTGGTTNRGFLNDGRLDKVATSGGSATTTDLVIDFSGATSVIGFAVLNHSMATWTAPTVTIVGADDASMTTNAVTKFGPTSVVRSAPNHKDAVFKFGSSSSRRYWMLRFVDSSARTLSLGEVYGIAAVTTLSRKKTYGHSETEEYRLNSIETQTGERRGTFLSGPIRTKKLPFADVQGSERDELMAMWRATYGGALPLLWLEDAGTTAVAREQECILGKLQPSFGWTERDYDLFDATALELRSLAREVGA